MDKEKILLDALNTFGNFTSVEQEFNYNQLEAIYEAMNQVLQMTNVVGQSEKLKALEDLKDFAYDNCQLHNSDRLAEIMERL